MSKSGYNENEELITHSLEAAAHEAAMADGLIPTDGTDSKLKKAGLRRGKWTAEEESYANRLIYEFKLGLLPLTDGTTLRTFLSKLLNCDPMRISKKFVGQNCIGKQVFRRRQQDLEKLTPEQIETSRKELAELERKFLERVAQTNRTKTSGVKVVKDGRADDENGNQAIAPWMVPPDEVQSTGNDSSQRSTAPTPNANSSSSYVVKDPPFTAPPAFPNNPPTNNRMIGYGVGPDMLTVDYQHVISANNALMNQLYQGAQFPYMPNYPLPPPGFLRPDYHMNNPMNPGNIKPEQMGMHYPPFDPYYGMHLQNNLIDANGQFRNDAFPWSQHGALNGHDLHSSTSNAGNNNGSSSSNAGNGHEVPTNSLTHYPNNGNSTSEWNLQNLLGAGESMENIVQFLSQYQGNSQSFENVQAALHNSNNPSHSGSNSSNNNMKKEDGEKESHLKDSEKDNHSKKNSMDDVGYPLDDGAVTTISTSTPAPVNSSSSVRKTSPQNDRSKSDVNNSVNKSGETKAGKELSEMNGYIIPSDTMASMAPLYQRNGLSDQARMGPPFMSNLPMPGMDPAQTSFGAAAAAVANGGNLPRNSSIENFWMLVRMGDLPRPDQDVLSETIWEAHQQGGPKNGNPLKPEGPSKSSDSNSVSSNSKNVPSIPSSSLGLGRVKEETGKNLYPQGHPARIVPPIIVPPPNTNWLPAESRKRNEEAMSDRSSASYSNPPKPSSESTHYAKKVKIEKD